MYPMTVTAWAASVHLRWKGHQLITHTHANINIPTHTLLRAHRWWNTHALWHALLSSKCPAASQLNWIWQRWMCHLNRLMKMNYILFWNLRLVNTFLCFFALRSLLPGWLLLVSSTPIKQCFENQTVILNSLSSAVWCWVHNIKHENHPKGIPNGLTYCRFSFTVTLELMSTVKQCFTSLSGSKFQLACTTSNRDISVLWVVREAQYKQDRYWNKRFTIIVYVLFVYYLYSLVN